LDFVDVIIPSLGKGHFIDCIRSLKHISFGIKLHVVTEGNSWPEAINHGLSESTNDVILMDDDVRILPDTFKHLDKYYDEASMFGFKLLFGNGRIQHAGGFCKNASVGHIGWNCSDNEVFNEPYYCCHVTSSLVYIKREVVDKLQGMAKDYHGYQFEDVDFSFRAIKEGFKLLYLPGEAIHLESESKSKLPDFDRGFQKNYQELKNRFLSNDDFRQEVESYPRMYAA